MPGLGAVSCKKSYASSRVSGNLNPRGVIIWLLGPELLDYFSPILQVIEVLAVPQQNKTVGEVVVTVNEDTSDLQFVEVHWKCAMWLVVTQRFL